MTATTDQTRDSIILAAAEDAVFDGWSWDGVLASAERAGLKADLARAVFPGGLADVLDGFADLADRRMMDHLATLNPTDMRVRDKVRAGVIARLEYLARHKEAVRAAGAFWARPSNTFHAGRVLWRTADHIWLWAGDTATDYNHYTKRGLLSGILASTTLAWLAPENDDDPAMPKTLDFLDRRIDNALSVGQLAGRFPFFRKAS